MTETDGQKCVVSPGFLLFFDAADGKPYASYLLSYFILTADAPPYAGSTKIIKVF